MGKLFKKEHEEPKAELKEEAKPMKALKAVGLDPGRFTR